MADRPRFLLAAPASGSGKTLLTCGILQALVDRGMRVSSFKCGPDYIDPMFHERVIGTRSGNLDLFFSGEALLRQLFCENAAGTELSVIEGVMGYYDGLGAATDAASSYQVARALEAPVVLIVGARGQSLSALATVKGFLSFRRDSGIRGVIFNQMSEHVYRALRDDVAALGVTPLGYVPRCDDLVIESRHLGLVTPDEVRGLSERLRRLAALLEQTVDLDQLIRLARSAPALSTSAPELPEAGPPVRLAVAEDAAFCFSYRDNRALLQKLGAELLPVSPLRDTALPKGSQGLLLCGGYPELYAQALSENRPMRQAVEKAVLGGLPCLAECGGFLYLHRELEDMAGTCYPMAGVIDARATRRDRLGPFGYLTLTADRPSAFLAAGETLRGHEFHYYQSTDSGADMTAVKPVTGKSWPCMHARGNLLAGFPHLHYYANPAFVQRFLRRCGERSAH